MVILIRSVLCQFLPDEFPTSSQLHDQRQGVVVFEGLIQPHQVAVVQLVHHVKFVFHERLQLRMAVHYLSSIIATCDTYKCQHSAEIIYSAEYSLTNSSSSSSALTNVKCQKVI